MGRGVRRSAEDATSPVALRAERAGIECEFRRLLTQAREDAGLTQRAAARALGRSQSYVCKAENGTQRVHPGDLAVIARLYDKRISYFFGE